MIIMKTKNQPFLDFIDEKIAQKENLILERKGTQPHDFDMLVRYLEVRKHYEEVK